MNTATPKRSLRKIGTWAGLLALVVAAASCVQILDGAYEYQPICTTEAECDDANPCTIDECLPDSSCLYTPVANGPLPSQTVGDCRRDECMDGELVSTNDDADIRDDAESCTTDSCANGSPAHTPVTDGTTCIMGESAGSCSNGSCVVECTASTPCNDSNPCTKDSCNAATGTCTFAPLDGIPTPGIQDTPGDCRLRICESGMDMEIIDDSDVPDDMNVCTENLCTAGVPSNPSSPAGIPCVVGEPGVCDGQGMCVQCNVPADCTMLPPDDDCQQRTCVNHVCGQTFTTSGTPISMQTDGDCIVAVCNGLGWAVLANLDTDLPDDQNPCTEDLCAGGGPLIIDRPAGFSCGTQLVCDGKGMCVECNTASDCAGTDDFCKVRTCVNHMCGYSFTPTGTDLPIGQTSMDCKVVECDGQGNIVTSVDQNDKPVDNNQCTQDLCSVQGVPSNPFEPVNTACNQNGGTICNGAGVCKKANGDTCAVSSECLSGHCVDGYCCDTACAGVCQACSAAKKGDGLDGICGPIAFGTDPDNDCSDDGASSCGHTGECDGMGSCQFYPNGTICAPGSCTADVQTNPDTCDGMGVCIDNGTINCAPFICGPTSCHVFCSGDTDCASGYYCDGGICVSLLSNGNACVSSSQCMSGYCADGFCCDTACSGLCETCWGILQDNGIDGVCGYVKFGFDFDDECPDAQECDGMGMCQ